MTRQPFLHDLAADEHFAGLLAGSAGAIGQDVVNLLGIGGQFRAFGPCRGKIVLRHIG